MEENQVTIRRQEVSAFNLPDAEELKHQIEAINRFQGLVHQFMVEGQDYGVIPGTSKPSLLKPGAEKITKLLGLADTYALMDTVEDWERGLFRYLVKCSLRHNGEVISEGMGECNSLEAKYRWREARKRCPECGAESIIKGKEQYGGGWLCFTKKGGCGAKWADGDEVIESQATGQVPNDDIYSLVNTILKMAEKRALVDAALHAGRLSNVFTQDIEDITDISGGSPKQPQSQPQPQPQPQPQSQPQLELTKPGTSKPVKSPIDLEWLRERLESLQWADFPSWLRKKYQVDGSTITEMVSKLTPAQAAEVASHPRLNQQPNLAEQVIIRRKRQNEG